MDWTKSSLMVVGATLALAISSNVEARPGRSESWDDVTFSQAVADHPANRLRSDPSHSTDPGDSLFGGDSLLLERGHTNSKATWKQLADDQDRVSAVGSSSHGSHAGAPGEPRYLGNHGHRISPVAAIPEPTTYALLVAGLAGIVFMTRRRRLARWPSCEASIGCICGSPGLSLGDWKSPNTQTSKITAG